jgi:hypothetical protein
MNKHLIVIGMTLMLLAVGLSGCNEISNPLTGNDDNRFVGTWKSNGSTITFFSDGEGSQYSLSFQWEIKDDKLVLEYQIAGSSTVYTYQFSNNDKSLTLTDVSIGTPRTYTKQ